MNAIDEFISQYPKIQIKDGYETPPTLLSTDDESVWVRGVRQPDNGIWFMVDDNINEQLIYPGNVILLDRNKNFTRNMVEIPFKAEERKSLPMDAKYSNEIMDGHEIVSFTRAGVNAYINKCLTNYKKGSHDLASNSRWEYRSSNRIEGVTLGGTIKSISFSAKMSRNKTVTVAFMRQIMYTVSLDNTLTNPSDIFTDKVDINKFRTNIERGGGGTPAIIDAVRYGRIITVWVEQEGSEAPSISVDKYFTLSVGRTNDSTRYHVRIYGGVAGDQQFAIDTDSQETLKNCLNMLKEVSKTAMEGALPMEYSLKYLDNMTTNIEWKVLPYFMSRIRQVLVKVIDNNKGASFGVYVKALKYELRGDTYAYYKWESQKLSLDTSFYLPARTLCIDIIVDPVDGTDKANFNIMIPCIPLDSMDGPNSDGDWEFVVRIQGNTLCDTKNFHCSPNQPGTYISYSKNFSMNRYNDSPLNYFNNRSTFERDVLGHYYTWFKAAEQIEKNLRVWTSINSADDFRPERRKPISGSEVATSVWKLIYSQGTVEKYCNGVLERELSDGKTVLYFEKPIRIDKKGSFRIIFDFEALESTSTYEPGDQVVLVYDRVFMVWLKSNGKIYIKLTKKDGRTAKLFYSTGLNYKIGEEQSLDIIYYNKSIHVNGKTIANTDIEWYNGENPNLANKLSSQFNGSGSPSCFHGYIRNVKVYNHK